MSHSDQNHKNEQPPIVLCHAACTGGSLTYRLLVTSFGYCGLSEIGHARRHPATRYSPLDPESQMYSRREIDPEEFGDILFDRVRLADEIARKKGRRLLLREHTHGFFFNPESDQTLPEGPSWAIDHYRKNTKTLPPLIVSVRDPIDSWLGFRRNFAHEAPTEFSEYCRIYNEFMDRIDRSKEQGDPVYLFRYEDLVCDENQILSEIASFVGDTFTGVDHEQAATTASSGNSGRQSSKLKLRRRRPFTSNLLKAAENSQEYVKLCERLGYDCIHQNLSTGDRVKAQLYRVVAFVGGFSNWIESPARWVYDKLKGSGNIQ